jgi:hypothetical protein
MALAAMNVVPEFAILGKPNASQAEDRSGGLLVQLGLATEPLNSELVRALSSG